MDIDDKKRISELERKVEYLYELLEELTKRM
jgi:hypothetical protein